MIFFTPPWLAGCWFIDMRVVFIHDGHCLLRIPGILLSSSGEKSVLPAVFHPALAGGVFFVFGIFLCTSPYL